MASQKNEFVTAEKVKIQKAQEKSMHKYSTPQEEFWAGDFGKEYIGRNESPELMASNLKFFSSALKNAPRIASCLEFGANIGMNLRALALLYPDINLKGIEINPSAANTLSELIGSDNVFRGSIFEYPVVEKSDLVLVKTVLIHINPEMLNVVYEKMYQASSRYILLCEYYNPMPTSVGYRGHTDRLYKRDFAGEMLDKYSNLKLVEYGFAYHRDSAFPQDDITWFLMQKS
jgi:pseudaminic acid biosynthesis-associated methylase